MVVPGVYLSMANPLLLWKNSYKIRTWTDHWLKLYPPAAPKTSF